MEEDEKLTKLLHELKAEETINPYLPNTYQYSIENPDINELKKIHKKEFSTANIYLEPYKDNTALKVITIDDDIILGDFPHDKVQEILSLNIKNGRICVDKILNNDGVQEIKGTLLFKRKNKNNNANTTKHISQVNEKDIEGCACGVVAIIFLILIILIWNWINSLF